MRGFGQGDRHVFERNRTRIDDFDFDEFMRVERRLELFDDLRRWTAMPDVDDGFEIVSEPAQLAALPASKIRAKALYQTWLHISSAFHRLRRRQKTKIDLHLHQTHPSRWRAKLLEMGLHTPNDGVRSSTYPPLPRKYPPAIAVFASPRAFQCGKSTAIMLKWCGSFVSHFG